MNPIITALIIYITGVVVAAFILRLNNSFQNCKYECIPPPFCLLSWLTVVIGILGFIAYSVGVGFKHFNFSLEKIENFLNCVVKYTDKE
jgi:hypothetical protein